jgi:hypothetical protein
MDAYQESEALRVKFPAPAANARAPRSVVRSIVYEAEALFEGVNRKVSPFVRATVPFHSTDAGSGETGMEAVMVTTALAASGVDPHAPYQYVTTSPSVRE